MPGSWACGSPALPTGSRDVEHQLAGREGAGAGAGGGAVPTRYGWAHLHVQHRFWILTPGEGAGLSFSRVAQGVRRRAGVGILTVHG